MSFLIKMKLINFRAVMKNFALDRIVLSPDSRCVAAAIIFAAILIPFRTTGKISLCFIDFLFLCGLKHFTFHFPQVDIVVITTYVQFFFLFFFTFSKSFQSKFAHKTFYLVFLLWFLFLIILFERE